MISMMEPRPQNEWDDMYQFLLSSKNEVTDLGHMKHNSNSS